MTVDPAAKQNGLWLGSRSLEGLGGPVAGTQALEADLAFHCVTLDKSLYLLSLLLSLPKA